MQGVKDASGLYEVERRAYHAARPGFRIAELQIGPTQKVPWHYHSNVHDTFYMLTGSIRIFLLDLKEEIRLMPGRTFAVPPKRPHLVTNAGDTSAVFLVLQHPRIRFRSADLTGSEYDWPITNRWIGAILRNRLNIGDFKSHGVDVVPTTERAKVETLCARYG